MAAYRHALTASRQRGLPLLGLEITAPGGVELTPVASGALVVRCCERRADGRTLGELEVSMFSAALLIDRDGILEEKAREIAEAGNAAGRVESTVAVSLPGASGYRADVEPSCSALPYVHVFAMAPDLGVDGGIVVIVRSALPEWAAAEAILGSLRFLTRHGMAQVANDETEAHAPLLPIAPK